MIEREREQRRDPAGPLIYQCDGRRHRPVGQWGNLFRRFPPPGARERAEEVIAGLLKFNRSTGSSPCSPEHVRALAVRTFSLDPGIPP